MFLQELKNDPLGIFRPLTKLHHNLVLASAYAAAAEKSSSDASGLKQRRCLDAKYKEPKVTPAASAASAHSLCVSLLTNSTTVHLECRCLSS